MRLRRQDRPADIEHAFAAPERHRKGLLHQHMIADAPVRHRQRAQIPFGPHEHRALAAQIGEIDPGRAFGAAVDQDTRAFRRVMADIAALPHRADDIDQRLLRRRAITPRDFLPQRLAGKEGRAVAVIEARQHLVIGDEHDRHDRKHRAPMRENAAERSFGPAASGYQHDPRSEKQPERIAPHRDGAAPAQRRQRDHRDGRAEGEQRHDPEIEIRRRGLRVFVARPEQRQRDQQGRQQKEDLSQREGARMQKVIDRSARGRRARGGVGEGQEIVAHEPEKMRRHDRKRARPRDPGARRQQAPSRARIEQQKKRDRHGEHDDEILGPERAPDRRAEQRPIHEPAATQRALQREARQRPERKLDHVVIELRRGVAEVMQPIGDQDGRECSGRPGDRQGGGEHQPKRNQHRDLRQRVIGEVVPNRLARDFDQPPGQRRQLVVAELPFPPVGQSLDQVERKVRVEQARQQRPDQPVQSRE